MHIFICLALKLIHIKCTFFFNYSSLFDTEEFRNRRLTVFDPQLIIHAKDERSLHDIDLGKYILNSSKETEGMNESVESIEHE